MRKALSEEGREEEAGGPEGSNPGSRALLKFPHPGVWEIRPVVQAEESHEHPEAGTFYY